MPSTLSSKPGAPAAAAYLHHAVVGLHKEGHGMLLGEVSFTCSRVRVFHFFLGRSDLVSDIRTLGSYVC